MDVIVKGFEAYVEHLKEIRHTGRIFAELILFEGGIRRVEYFEKKEVSAPALISQN